MGEGRKRELRRLCCGIDAPVLDLVRVGLGPLGLGQLGEGRARPLTAAELSALYAARGDGGAVSAPRGHRRRAGRERQDDAGRRLAAGAGAGLHRHRPLLPRRHGGRGPAGLGAGDLERIVEVAASAAIEINTAPADDSWEVRVDGVDPGERRSAIRATPPC